MKRVLLVLAAMCGVIAIEARHATAHGAAAAAISPPQDTNAPRCAAPPYGPPGTGCEFRDLTAMDATMPRDPWRNGDPLLVPRRLRPAVPANAAFVVPGTIPPPSTAMTPRIPPRGTWESPLAHDLSIAHRGRRSVARPIPAEPRQAGKAARALTEVALFGLSFAGKISGTGRDTTGDIGKPPLGIRDSRSQPGIQGAIK